MRRYIDADKLQEAFKELHGGKRSLLIDTAPTADVVEVVLCKECKYNAKGDNESEFWNLCRLRPWVYVPVSDEDYCSRGERRTG